MVRIHWQGRDLMVRRIVLGRTALEGAFGEALRRVATPGDVSVVDEVAEPQAGDFWIGCHPERGWQDLGAEQIGWANGLEAPLALAQLRGSEAVAELFESPLILHRASSLESGKQSQRRGPILSAK